MRKELEMIRKLRRRTDYATLTHSMPSEKKTKDYGRNLKE